MTTPLLSVVDRRLRQNPGSRARSVDLCHLDHGHAGRCLGPGVSVPALAANADLDHADTLGGRWVGRHDLARPGSQRRVAVDGGAAWFYRLVRRPGTVEIST